MRNKKEIINNYKENLKSLKKHNKFYFSYDNPKITDEKYDELNNADIFLFQLLVDTILFLD